MSNLTKSDFAALDEQIDIATDKLNRRKTDQGWHLKKEISLSLIIGVITTFAMGMVAYGDLKRDVALIQADVQSLHSADSETRELLRETVQRISVTIDKMDTKLERLMERGKP
jgi:hypothetical protein